MASNRKLCPDCYPDELSDEQKELFDDVVRHVCVRGWQLARQLVDDVEAEAAAGRACRLLAVD